jgi:hypothetical protein
VPEEEDTAATPELHRAGAPIVFTSAAVLPARLRPTGFDPPPHQPLSPSAPPVRIATAIPLFPPYCQREPSAADEPTVASHRTTFPFRPPCHLFLQEPDAPPFSLLPPSPRHRRIVPRARDAGAPRTARPRRGPGKPGLARLNLAVHAHPRDVAFASRPSRWGFSPSTLRVLTLTHTLRRHGAHTHTLTPICTPDPNPATPDPAEADMWDHAVSEREGRADAASPRGGEGPAQRGEEERRSSPRRRRAGPRRSQAEPMGLEPAHHLFWPKTKPDRTPFSFS